jgi:hypothetical protein
VCYCTTYDVVQPDSAVDQQGRRGNTCKLNNSLIFSRSVSLSLFLFSCREGGWETVGDHAGGCRLRKSDHQLYSPTV